MKSVKDKWFRYSLEYLHSKKGLNQDDIAREIGVTSPMISKVKLGRSPAPDSLIDKMVKQYDIPPPYHSNRESREVTESLKVIIADLRRELMEVYDHISTLKEFNQFLKTRKSA